MDVKDIATVGLSAIALAVSLVTAWATMWRRGNVYMTQPTLVHFGYDRSARSDAAKLQPKVYLRTLLFSSGKRGNVIESMFIRLRCGDTVQAFNVWVLGERELARGSGLHVSESGITCNHHFLLPPDGTEFVFREGDYTVDVFATLFRRREPIKLHTSTLRIRESDALTVSTGQAGLFYDWRPESGRYSCHIDSAPATAVRSLAR